MLSLVDELTEIYLRTERIDYGSGLTNTLNVASVRLSVNDTSPAPQVIQHRNHPECEGR